MDATALDFRPRDRAAYLPAADALVLADLHLGRGEPPDVGVPTVGQTVDRVAALLEWCAPEAVVLAGDVVHSFAGPSAVVERAFEALADRVAAAAADLTVVAGNHDGALASIATPVDAAELADGTVVCHGHETPGRSAHRYVVGHDHPAVVIEGVRRPCYLHGTGVHRGGDVLALPAFDPLARGTLVSDLGRHDPASPLLAELGAFRPVVWDPAEDETYVFPPLSASGAHL